MSTDGKGTVRVPRQVRVVPELWNKLKARAALEGMSLEDQLELILRREVDSPTRRRRQPQPN